MGHEIAAAPLPVPSRYVTVEEEMRKSYIDYAMSVIVSRALPDVRDGLKPVHRRILYSMYQEGVTSSKAHRKSARVVGDVMGKYHPHGDSAIYEAMVRMAQSFAMGTPLIDGMGNFGNIDGDPAAAMRYTEARLDAASDAGMVQDLNEGTVDYTPTYDESDEEPRVLPARFPNILVNGGMGIAVGMASSIPPHNLGEVIDATLALAADPSLGVDDLMRYLPGPDFPTGAVIQGRAAIREAYLTGRGSVVVAGVASIEPMKGNRESLVITELPYNVNKARLVEKIAELVNAKEIEGVSDLRDESDGDGVRIVVELKRDADPNLVLNKLRKMTKLTDSFSFNANCLNSKRQPRTMGLVEILSEFLEFRRDVITRRTTHRVNKARDVLNTQVGLYAARSRVDEVVRTIRSASDADQARARLMALDFEVEGELATLISEIDPDVPLPPVFKLSEDQVTAILAMPLRSLTGLEQDKIAAKARDLLATIAGFVEILNNPATLDALMRQEMMEVRAKFAVPRRTRIESAGPADLNEDDFVENKPVVLTLTRGGYVKVTPLDAYREQSRGGKGKNGMETKEDDFVARTMTCMARTNLIFFTSRGIAHTIKAYKLPQTVANARGKPIINFLPLRQGETIATVMPMPQPDEAEGRFMMFVTDAGEVRRNSTSDFARVNANGKVAMRLEDDNGVAAARLIAVELCTEEDDVVLATRKGKAVRFPVPEVRVFKGRDSTGIRGVSLGHDDAVIGASIVRHFEATPQERDAYLSEGHTTRWKDEATREEHSLTLSPERVSEMAAAEQHLLTVTAKGYGKRFSSHDFRTTGRGTQGVWVGTFNEGTGDLVACFPVREQEGIVMVTAGGQFIRTRAAEVRTTGRSARGVKMFDLPEGQCIVDVAPVPAED